MIKNAVGYVRVSSEEQINNYSLANQSDKCKEYCSCNGYKLLKIFKDEGKSATSLNRPALIELLEFCRLNKGKLDALIIYKIDRLSRETFDYLAVKRRLAEYGITIVSITEQVDNTPAGEFMETLMAASAKLDNATKSVRTKDGMSKRLEAGLPTNPLSVGYKYKLGDGNKNYPVRDEPRFSQMQQAGYDYLTGIYTKKQIAELLNKRGFTTRNGKTAASQFISKFFSNEFYKGVIYSKVRNKYFPGKYEQMFTEEEWYRIQQISEGSSFTAQPKKRNHPDFPLRHFALCEKCGEPITGNWCQGRSKRYPYYRCLNHSPSIPTEEFETQFYDYLLKIKPKQETVKKFTKILKEKYDAKYKDLTKDVDTLNKELDSLMEERKALAKKNMTGVYDDEVYKELDDELKNKIVVKKVQINEGSMQKLDIETICAFAEHFIQHIAQTWKNADLSTKQRLQEMIFPEGVTYCFPGYTTTFLCCLFEILQDPNESDDHLGWLTGIEPATSASTEQRSTIELQPPY